MVKKYFCDKCGKELEYSHKDEFERLFDEDREKFEEGFEKIKIEKPQLCEKCQKGYNKIIKEANKKIREYLKG